MTCCSCTPASTTGEAGCTSSSDSSPAASVRLPSTGEATARRRTSRRTAGPRRRRGCGARCGRGRPGRDRGLLDGWCRCARLRARLPRPGSRARVDRPGSTRGAVPGGHRGAERDPRTCDRGRRGGRRTGTRSIASRPGCGSTGRMPKGACRDLARDLFVEMNAHALRQPDPGERADRASTWDRLGEIAAPALVMVGTPRRAGHPGRRRDAGRAGCPTPGFVRLDGVAHVPHLEGHRADARPDRSFIAETPQ